MPAIWRSAGGLLTLYSASDSKHIRRLLAKKVCGDRIHNPHLNVFGTAIPSHSYRCLTEKVLTDGLLARFIVYAVSGERVANPDQISPEPPDGLVERVRELGREIMQPDVLGDWPEKTAMDVQYDEEGKAVSNAFRDKVDKLINNSTDEPHRAVLGRVWEHAT